MITEHTVSTAVEASVLFDEPEGINRRRRRSPQPVSAVNYQFERVSDIVAAEALVLCDDRGRNLSGVGNSQLCRMLSQSVPAIFTGEATKDVQLKGMDIIRPGIDWTNIAIRPLRVEHRRRHLFVASVSESQFNLAGVHHASGGVRRILGLPSPVRPRGVVRITSRDRLAFDVARAMELGYHNFFSSRLANELRVPRRFGPSQRVYMLALNHMLSKVSSRLEREGLIVAKPTIWDRWFKRGVSSFGSYRTFRLALPIRQHDDNRRCGTLDIDMTVYGRQFEIPKPPNAILNIEKIALAPN